MSTNEEKRKEDTKTGMNQSLRGAIRRLDRNLRRRPYDWQRSRGYNRLLRLIEKHEGAIPREFAEWMGIRPPSLTELLVKLENDGMIRRNGDKNDLRITRIYLKENGRKHLEELKARDTEDDHFTDILSEEERNTLIELCNKFSEGLEKRSQASD